MFNTPYKRNKSAPEKNISGDNFVEDAGFMPIGYRVKQMSLAGARLNESRIEAYDFPDEGSIDEKYSDPTRVVGYDMADASQQYAETRARIQDKIKTIQEARKTNLKVKDTTEIVKTPSDENGEV